MNHSPDNKTAGQTVGKKGSSDTELMRLANASSGTKKVRTYLRLIGPGWLQSALKLGGGTMTNSLYIGVISGFSLMWVHPLAMLFGIIMLWGLGYVVMCTGLRPFRAITDHVNPVLGWGWVIAALLSSMIWDLPQYAMAHAVMSQNLLPSIFGPVGLLGDMGGRVCIAVGILLLCTAVTWSYDNRGVGVRFFDKALQWMVWIKTGAFVGVVMVLAFSQSIPWGEVMKGLFSPDLGLLSHPAKSYLPLLGPLSAEARQYWSALLVATQRDLIIASAASAAGVNGTFLFGYSVLRRRWGKEFLIFSRIDLLAGMLLPVTITTSCVIIAGAYRFHTVPQEGLIAPESTLVQANPGRVAEYNRLLEGRVKAMAASSGETLSASETVARAKALSLDERKLAAALVTRDGFELAASLEPLTGKFVAHIVFGIGVLGMCLSSIILHMTVCGIIFCEFRNVPHGGWTFRLGSMAAAVGTIGPFVSTKAAFWLAIPVAVFSYTLIPLTYITFFVMMNSRNLLGKNLPSGGRRWAWNIAMGTAVLFFCASSIWMLSHKGSYAGYILSVAFLVAALVAHFLKKRSGPLAPAPAR